MSATRHRIEHNKFRKLQNWKSPKKHLRGAGPFVKLSQGFIVEKLQNKSKIGQKIQNLTVKKS